MNTYMGKIIQYISREDGASETMVDRDICERISNQINNLRKRKRHPLILYVDDMASVGWKDLLSHILFGEMNSRNLRTVYFSQEHSPEEIANNIMNAGLKKADLLILDLRLKDEKGFVRPSELSGMKVLRRLEKNGSLCCPVMIFTASNKIWSLKEAFRNNVVSYYIKEGLDYSDDDMSMHSFLNLIEQINFLTAYSWIFKLLSKLRKMSATIRFEKGSFWWETLRASYTARSKNIKKTFHRKLTQKKDICIILNKVIESVQRDVRAICFFENYLNVSDVLCSMIVKLAGVLEEIHTSVDGDEPHTLCFKMKAHLPNIETSKYTFY